MAVAEVGGCHALEPAVTFREEAVLVEPHGGDSVRPEVRCGDVVLRLAAARTHVHEAIRSGQDHAVRTTCGVAVCLTAEALSKVGDPVHVTNLWAVDHLHLLLWPRVTRSE